FQSAIGRNRLIQVKIGTLGREILVNAAEGETSLEPFQTAAGRAVARVGLRNVADPPQSIPSPCMICGHTSGREERSRVMQIDK
ncbi:UNVERIFIED_CONTAM: hypothetical protein NY603_30615, partial [Bacteroidetes bacterium 56_B9]